VDAADPLRLAEAGAELAQMLEVCYIFCLFG
jgi:hypothetical protein